MAAALNVPVTSIQCTGASDSAGAIGNTGDAGLTTLRFVLLNVSLGSSTPAAVLSSFNLAVFNSRIGQSATSSQTTLTCTSPTGCPSTGGGGSSGLSGGAIAGIVIGIVVAVCILLLVLVYCFVSGRKSGVSTGTDRPSAAGAYTQEQSEFTKPDYSQAGTHSQVELADYHKADESKVQAEHEHGETANTDVEHVETDVDGEGDTAMI